MTKETETRFTREQLEVMYPRLNINRMCGGIIICGIIIAIAMIYLR